MVICLKLNPPLVLQDIVASAKKKARSSQVKYKWFNDPNYDGVIQRNHPKDTGTSVFCLPCDKIVNVEHQGERDLVRYTARVKHIRIDSRLRECMTRLIKLLFSVNQRIQ